MKNIKILHIGNTAGIGSIIAKYMDKFFGTESLVVNRRASDPYGLTTYGELWYCGAKMFTLKCLWLARRFDIVHVHYFDKVVPFLKFLYPRKPVVLHYHGDDIRGKAKERSRYYRRADFIIVSTYDLLETLPAAVHIPNPVDTDLFYPKTNYKRKPKSALAFCYHLDEKKAINYAQKYGLQLTFLERNIPYKEMPKILNRYEYYVDRTEISSLSKTALEALACGCKVINWKGEIVYPPLQEQHTPQKVCNQLYKIYHKLIIKNRQR